MRWRSPIAPGSSGLAEQFSAAICKPAGFDLFQLGLQQAFVGEQFVGAKVRALGPAAASHLDAFDAQSATHLSSMSVKDRLPMTSVQMESFIS